RPSLAFRELLRIAKDAATPPVCQDQPALKGAECEYLDEMGEGGAREEENKGVGIRFRRNNIAEPAVAADGAGRTAFRGMTSFQPAPLLNGVVRPPGSTVSPGFS